MGTADVPSLAAAMVAHGHLGAAVAEMRAIIGDDRANRLHLGGAQPAQVAADPSSLTASPTRMWTLSPAASSATAFWPKTGCFKSG